MEHKLLVFQAEGSYKARTVGILFLSQANWPGFVLALITSMSGVYDSSIEIEIFHHGRKLAFQLGQSIFVVKA